MLTERGEYVDGQALSHRRLDGDRRRLDRAGTHEAAASLSSAPGPGGRPLHEWLEVRPFLTDSPVVARQAARLRDD